MAARDLPQRPREGRRDEGRQRRQRCRRRRRASSSSGALRGALDLDDRGSLGCGSQDLLLVPQGPRGDSRKERRREGGRRRRRRVGRRGPRAGTRDGGRLRGGAGGCRCCFRFRFYFRASRFGWGYLYRRNRLRNLRCSVPCAAPSRLVVGVGVVVVFAVSKVLARARRLREVRAHRRRLRPQLPVQKGVWQSRRRRQGAAVGAAGTRRKRRWSEGNWSSSDLFRSCFPSQQQRHRSQASLLPLEVPEPASSSPACELMRNRAAFAFVQHWEYKTKKNETKKMKKTPVKKLLFHVLIPHAECKFTLCTGKKRPKKRCLCLWESV